jgi:hypothetical protein
MKLKIEMDMDNAAFENGRREFEANRILSDLGAKLMTSTPIRLDEHWLLWDANGNQVGQAEVCGEWDDRDD